MAWVHGYYVLSVGQGTGTLVQACKDDLDQPRWSAIIDLGSEGWIDKKRLPSAKFAAEKLKKGEQSEEVTLDAVILSHSDSDHINLIPDLLAEFSKPRAKKPKTGKPKLTVKEVWYGGDRDKYQKGDNPNVLDELYEYRPVLKPDTGTNINGLPDDASSLDKTAPDPLVESGKEAWIWLVVGNTVADQVSIDANKATRTARGCYATNTVSLVVATVLGSGTKAKEIFATGDATGLTIAKCREMIQKSKEKNKIAPSLSVSLPHHGSASTTYNLLGIKGKGPTGLVARQNIEGFARELGAITVTASAGERSTYRHPAIGVVEDFGAHVKEGAFVDGYLKPDKEHFYTAYMGGGHFKYLFAVKSVPSDWPSKAGWYSARAAQNAFTTDYFLDPLAEIPSAWKEEATYRTAAESKFKPSPPRTMSWLFVVEDGGTKWRIEKPIDTLGLDARQRRWVEEAIGGPLPPDRFVHIPSADARG